MIKLTDEDGEVWVEPRHVLTMRPFGTSVEIRIRDGLRIYAKNTTCAKLARQVAGSEA